RGADRGASFVGESILRQALGELYMRGRRTRRPRCVVARRLERRATRTDPPERSDPSRLGPFGAAITRSQNRALSCGECHLVPPLALVISELLEKELDAPLLLVPALLQIWGDGIAPNVKKRRSVARGLVDRDEHAHLLQRIERRLAIRLG